MKTKLLTIAMTAALMLTAMTKVQAQNFDGPCLPPSHGLDGHQSAFCGAMQVIALVSGFNWVSVNVDITLDDLKAALLEALPDATSITISAKNQNTTYNGSTWRGSLRVLDVKQMYKIKVPGACSIELTGDPLDPAELTITMVAGNTWIGYPLSESMALSDAFAGFAVAGDKITSKNGNATCLGNNRWRGSLTTLVPGQGYIYKSATGGEFTYPTGSSK